MLSANSLSLIGCTLIFFTITEWPLTEVATDLVLIECSPKILLIALETLPESTIMESTTMSLASGSTPRCETTISPLDFFSSIALMQLEPMSNPTIDFPDPNMPSALSLMSFASPVARTYRAEAALAAFGFFLAPLMLMVLFCSIHWSRMVFLNFQRFPSLKAGIFSSVTYLYSVSGLTPKYCEACRMFITSRESAAIKCSLPTVGCWPHQKGLWRKIL